LTRSTNIIAKFV